MLSRFVRSGIFPLEPIPLLFCAHGAGNLLDLWSFGRRLATAQVSVRTGKGRKFLCLFYLYIDLFRVRFVVQKGNGRVQVCRKL